ncbi:hypothetical protein HYH02_006112 [Chlamydomonas schloesseri]|uniref:Uncharacterized protein n=1 Tax=Chlamydomonas schloesseri TaxID=2026947 RepID=A0A835WK51_9CHLO|nr:hypothetical protein HYH02_006112 [Chlamydomonas schloesseri]|eukprot:KAG2448758.1 hypothetical protein HYH02_006112 [Chlamydomonas schloesseri]
MVGFNLLRALVLNWISRQPRSSSSSTSVSSSSSSSGSSGSSGSGPQQRQQPQGPDMQRSQQGGQRQGVTVDVELEPGPEASGLGLAAADAAATAERVASGAAAGPGPGSSGQNASTSSSSTSTSAAAASGPPDAASPSAGGQLEGQGQGEGEGQQQQPVVQMANYQPRERGRQGTSNLGRVVICAVLAPAGAAVGAAAAAAGTSGAAPSGGGFGANSAGPGIGDAAADAPQGSRGETSPAAAGAAGTAAAAGAAVGRAAPWRNPDWHSLFWKPLFAKYGAGAAAAASSGGGPSGGSSGGAAAAGEEERVTGLLVHYGDCVMHVLEGDNNLLFALLRELRPRDVGVHGLVEIRVPCYILDPRERLFDDWHTAAVPPPPPPPPSPARRGLTRADLKAAIRPPGRDGGGGLGPAGVGLGAGGRGDPLQLQPGLAGGAMSLAGQYEEGEDEFELDPAAAAAAEQELAAQQLVDRIQQLELFLKFMGPKLSALSGQAAREQALSSLTLFETTTPARAVVVDLATDLMAPALPDFVDAYDADYRRYVSLLALVEQRREEAAARAAAAGGGAGAGGGGKEAARAVLAGLGGLLSDIRHLGRFYDGHVTRDLQEALAERAEARRQSGSDEVARRLSQGMQLKVQQ